MAAGDPSPRHQHQAEVPLRGMRARQHISLFPCLCQQHVALLVEAGEPADKDAPVEKRDAQWAIEELVANSGNRVGHAL